MIFKQDEVLKQCFIDVNASWRANQVAASMKNVVPTATLMQGTEAERLQTAIDVLHQAKRGQSFALPPVKAPSLVGGLHTFFAREPKIQVSPPTNNTPKPKT